jgi:hypothetical protein
MAVNRLSAYVDFRCFFKGERKTPVLEAASVNNALLPKIRLTEKNADP